MSWRRVGAILRKELREQRRNRSALYAMAIFPLIFLVQPMVVIFNTGSAAAAQLADRHTLLYLLGVPILMPAVLGAYAVAGERFQDSLEPVLSTPIRSDEFLAGKALAAVVPAVPIGYLVGAVFVGAVFVFAQPGVATSLVRLPDVLGLVIFTPLLTALTTWISIAVSTRTSDPRVASQFSLLGSLPLLAGSTVVAFGLIEPTVRLAVIAGVVLLALDLAGMRLVARLINRENLITGSH